MFDQTAAGTAVRHLAAFSTELDRRGIESDVITTGYRPRLHLHLVAEALHPDAAFEDNVIAAPDADGRWLLWWPWAEQIADAGHPAKAAETICAELDEDPRKPDDHDPADLLILTYPLDWLLLLFPRGGDSTDALDMGHLDLT